MSSLLIAVQTLLVRELASDEKDKLNKFQQLYQIDDDDPLVVVLSLMGMNTVLFEQVPDMLRVASSKAIEAHEQILREQSTLIAKELILSTFQSINDAVRAQNTWMDRLIEYVLVFIVGGLTGGGIGWLIAKAL